MCVRDWWKKQKKKIRLGKLPNQKKEEEELRERSWRMGKRERVNRPTREGERRKGERARHGGKERNGLGDQSDPPAFSILSDDLTPFS